MVVAVLITNCQVSENLKIGPVTAHAMITVNAIRNAVEVPAALVTLEATSSNQSLKPFFPFSHDFFYLLISKGKSQTKKPDFPKLTKRKSYFTFLPRLLFRFLHLC